MVDSLLKWAIICRKNEQNKDYRDIPTHRQKNLLALAGHKSHKYMYTIRNITCIYFSLIVIMLVTHPMYLQLRILLLCRVCVSPTNNSVMKICALSIFLSISETWYE